MSNIQLIGIGEFGVSKTPGSVVKTLALGSCIALIMLDKATRTVGMAHVALPESKLSPRRAEQMPGYFADTALPALIDAFIKLNGSLDPKKVLVKLAGGANVMDKNHTFNIGKRNLLAIKKILWSRKMGARVEDCGGNISRTVTISVDTGKVTITSPGCEPKNI